MKGDWIQTYTGIQFWPLDPQIQDIHIEDIAHALSMICRFTGHCDRFYSVAEHSIRVCDALPNEFKLYGLLHDASEAYLTDISKPLKMLSLFEEYRKYEIKLSSAIYLKYGLSTKEPELVKEVDRRLLSTEARDLMKSPVKEWQYNVHNPLLEKIKPMSSLQSERLFLKRFRKLYK